MGDNCRFDPWGEYTYETITIGDDVSLGERPVLMASRSFIRVGSHVMFGPEVTIRGGNHRLDIPGKWMKAVRDTEKRPEDDLGVEVEDDVWIGTRAIILHGVKIGRGAVIGAGAVVTKSIPPYAIACGNPARVVRFRWNVDGILRHEMVLYPASLRLTREEISCFHSEGRGKGGE